jgi:peptide/nickel transport system ATP-binding protein
MNETPLIRVENLIVDFTSHHRTTRALKGISFEIPKGKTVGIVGESGSGKSVTSLSIMNLIPNPPGKITGGAIWYQDEARQQVDLTQLAPARMRQYRGREIAMIFQEPMTSLNPVFTCGDQVMEALRLHQKLSRAEARNRTLELFREVLLPEPVENIFRAYPHQISGGQKQRVMIAMAISCNPRLLIADEPTTALDVTVQKTILDILLRLQQSHGMSLMFITHDLGVIAEIADEVVVMYKGQIVETGPVKAIFANPQHPYTKGLLACRPVLDFRLKKLKTVADFMQEDASGALIELPQDQPIGTEPPPGHPNLYTRTEYLARQEALARQKPLLEIQGLKTYFPIKAGFWGRQAGWVKAVDDVSFSVYPGETVGLVGESGCGKTTLGRSILRLIEPTEGRIVFDGLPVSTLTQQELRRHRKHMQIIFQDPYSSLNPRKTVGAAILEPMEVHGVLESPKARREYVDYLLEKVNLPPAYYHRYPHEFSGGQRQRICIARTLALNPRFVVCDESVSALDVSVQAQVLNLLNELRDEFKLTYIFISHDLSVVKFMSDRMIVMQKGRVVEAGYSDDLYQNPQNPYTIQLIEAIPKGRLEDIERALSQKQTYALP